MIPTPSKKTLYKVVGINSDSNTIRGEFKPSNDKIDLILSCPITREPMIEPVITPYGHTYEKNAIEESLAISASDPFTKKELKSTDLIPNRALLELCNSQQTNGEPLVELCNSQQICYIAVKQNGKALHFVP